jgi:predicted Zn-dependent peptidase
MKHGKKIKICILLVILTVSLQAAFASQISSYLDNFEKRMTEFTLDNGMKFLVLERHEAPVVSFMTFTDVGAVNEVKGITGMAHIFEHMAFKGTPTIGSKDFKAESKALEKIEKTFDALKAERQKGDKADKAKLDLLEKQFKEAQEEADKYIVHDEFEQALTKEGASGLNAFTSNDETAYISSLPSNKLELWMYMESERFYEPVLREFYRERDVIMEERRMGENNPQQRLDEEFLSIAFKAHPYGEPVIGHMSDLQAITSEKAKAFYKKYYCPADITVAIVGDVNPQEVKKLAQIYFGRIQARLKPEPVETVEPPQRGERRVVLQEEAQPFLIIGYHIPSFNHPDSVALETLSDILSSGRTSRLYKSMVKEKKIAVSVSAETGFPGNKYPALFGFFVNPAKGHSNQECEEEIYAQIEKLKTEPVTAEELQKAKTLVRASLIRQLNSNMGLAMQIAGYEVLTGDWRNLFKRIEAIEKVTAEDIQRVSNEYFTVQNRTVGCIETKPSASADKSAK